MDLDTAFLQAALDRQLFSPDEGQAVLAEARTAGRPVSDLLVERGLLAARTVAALSEDLARKSGAPAPVAAGSAWPSGARSSGTPSGPAGLGAGSSADARTLAVQPAAGAPVVVGGDFELLEKLGEGGMGAVYRARQRSLQRPVAIKVLAPGYAANADAAARFVREARAAAAINHSNVITVFHVGQERGRLYMVMELVTGGDADQLARKHGGRLPERRALEVVRDAAQGLVAIERAGLVHRDIKPSNIFLTEDGAAKLADLGLARTQAGDDRMTRTGMIVGTPAFMAPEQANAQPVDVRTDVYALGATLFQLLAGRAPFEGPSALAVVAKVLNDPVPDLRAAAPDVSPATAAVVTRAMAKDPAARHASAQAFLEALQAALAAPPRQSSPSGRAAAAAAPVRSASGRAPARVDGAVNGPARAPSGRASAQVASAQVASAQVASAQVAGAQVAGAPSSHEDADGDARAGRFAMATIGVGLLLLLGLGVSLVASGRDPRPTSTATATEVPTPTSDTPAPEVTEAAPPATEAPTPPVTETLTPATETPAQPVTHPATPASEDTPPRVVTEAAPPATEAAPPATEPPTATEAPPPEEPAPPELSPAPDLPTPDLPAGPAPREGAGGDPGQPQDGRPARALMQLLEDVLQHEVQPVEFVVDPPRSGDPVANGRYALTGRLTMHLQEAPAHPLPIVAGWVVGELSPRAAAREARAELELALRTGDEPARDADALRDEAGLLARLAIDGDDLEVRVRPLGARADDERRERLKMDDAQPLIVGMHADPLGWTLVLMQRPLPQHQDRQEEPPPSGFGLRRGGRGAPGGGGGPKHQPRPPALQHTMQGRWNDDGAPFEGPLRPWASFSNKRIGVNRPVIAAFVRSG